MDIPEIPEDLKNSVLDGSCIPFFGAGVSTGSGLPTANKFLKENNVEYLDWKYGTAILESNPNFKQSFLKTFRDSKLRYNEIHRLLVHLESKHYITTNYDILFETAYENIFPARKLLTVNSDNDIPEINASKSSILKIHGDIKSFDYFIMTAQQYYKRIQAPLLVDKLFEVLFVTNTVLFLGYSLKDENILGAIYACAQLKSHDSKNKYILLMSGFKESVHKENKRLLELYSVNVINVRNPVGLRKFLEKLTELKRLETEGKISGNDRRLIKEIKPEEIVRKLIKLKDEHKTEEAIELIKKNSSDWDEHHYLLGEWLYNIVSIYDKRENWDALDTINFSYIKVILAKIKETAAAEVYNSIYNRYSQVMKLAQMRFLKVELPKNNDHINGDIDTKYTNQNFINADRMVIEACIYLVYYLFKSIGGNRKHLTQAKKLLMTAREIFDKYDSNETSHLRGRLYGCETYLYLIYKELGPIPNGLQHITNPVEYARKGPENKNCTKYGKVAGNYCLAYSLYKTALEEKSAQTKKEMLEEGINTLNIAQKCLEEDKKLSNFKISLLTAFIQKELSCKEAKNPEQVKRENRELVEILSKNIGKKNFSLKKWIGVPLN